jgi:autotransporter-associated beta strand protein
VTAGSDYVLIDYTTIAGTGFGSFSLPKLPPRMVANLVDNVGNTSIDIHVTSFDSPKWTGNGDKTWNLASTNNWQLINGGTPTTYQENLATYTTGDNVLFDDSTANGSVNITTTVSPGSIIVNNSSTGYTFLGTGTIAGAPALTKSGSQTLTIVNSGGATLGPIVISGGSLVLGNNATSGAGNGATGPVSVAGGATLVINRIDNSNFSGAISGDGSVVHSGSGTTTLSGASSYTGTTTLSNGTIRATSNASLGVLTGGAVTISGAGSLDVGGFATADAANFGQKQFNISGTGPGGGVGVLTNSSTANRQINAFQKVTLTADATVGGAGRFDVRSPSASPGAAVLDLAGFTLTKVGAGNFSIVRADATPGNIHVVGGIFNIEGSSNVTGAGTITYEPGTTAQFNSPTGTISRNMVMNGNTVFDAGQAVAANIASPVSFAGGTITMQINSSAGFAFSGDITETTPTGMSKTGNGTLVLSGAVGYTGATGVVAGTMQIAQSFRSSSALNVSDGARALMLANGNNVLQTGTLNLNATGTLDLADNDLVVDNGSYTDVRIAVLTGFGTTGPGIISSTSDGSQILALFDNALVGAGDWNGGAIGANAVVGKYTYFGDMNIDGQVTGDDYTVIDANLNTTPPTGLEWLSGDANLDGTITGDDYTVIDANLGLGVGNPLSPDARLSAVPEPALGLVAAGVFGCGMMRRRRSR